MFGKARIPVELLKKTLIEIGEEEGDMKSRSTRRRFRNLVLRELVFDSSLLRRREKERGTSFEML